MFEIGIEGVMNVRGGGKLKKNKMMIGIEVGYMVMEIEWVRIKIWRINI